MGLQVRAGIVPYYIDGNQIHVYLMIPSNAAYGGTEPQIAKGRVEEEGEQEAAIREGEEELGLIRSNIDKIEVGWSGNLSGMSASGYKFVVYIASIKDPKNFGKFHYETGWAGWISEQEISRVRDSQRQIVSAIIQKIRMANPFKIEGFSFANFFESIGGFNKEKNRSYRRSELIERLKKIVDEEERKGVDADQIWMTFSEVPRLNVYPKLANKIGKSTPTGVFAYPVEFFIKEGGAPYAGDRDFIIVFKTKAKPWDIGQPQNSGGYHTNYTYFDKISNLARDLRLARGSSTDNLPPEDVAERDDRIKEIMAQADFPRKDEFIKMAKDLGVNLANAIIAAKDRNTLNNENQFIYRVAEDMARQWAVKEGKPNNWFIRWNKLLQKFGYKNAVDLQHSSAIHGGEPTQGAFLDTTACEVIDIIHNRQFSATGNTSAEWWGSSASYTWDRRRAVASYTNRQRQNQHSPEAYQAKGWSDDRIREYGISNRIGSILNMLHIALADNQQHVDEGGLRSKGQAYPVRYYSLEKRLKDLGNNLRGLLKIKQSGSHVYRAVETLRNGLPMSELSKLDPNDPHLKPLIPLLKEFGITIRSAPEPAKSEPKTELIEYIVKFTCPNDHPLDQGRSMPIFGQDEEEVRLKFLNYYPACKISSITPRQSPLKTQENPPIDVGMTGMTVGDLGPSIW
jgi:8-oxo-dGTP pyrophosphatase MutT (NUDIX family)